MAVVAVLVVAMWASVGCAGGPSPYEALAGAEQQLGAAPDGAIALQLRATTDGSQPVGFRIEGRYSTGGGGATPVLDFTYARMPAAGPDVRILADGQRVAVGPADDLVDVPAEQLAGLRLDEGAGVVGALDLGAWIEEPTASVRDGRRTTTGSVDVAAFLSDLAAIASPVAGPVDLRTDEASSAALRERVEASEIEVVTDAETDELRSLHVGMAFGGDAGDELAEVLGPYAGLRLDLDLTFERLDAPITVELP